MQRLDAVDAQSLRTDIPAFRPGDTVRVHVRVVEGSRSRIQVFQGVITRRQGAGIRESFTVRKVSFGTGVERTFPVHSPTIERIELVTHGDVRRAKLYYLRDLRGKAAKIKERRGGRPQRSGAAIDPGDADAAIEAGGGDTGVGEADALGGDTGVGEAGAGTGTGDVELTTMATEATGVPDAGKR